jgi:hypothetical protein
VLHCVPSSPHLARERKVPWVVPLQSSSTRGTVCPSFLGLALALPA